ncbi:ankyrin repeat domain-containing protein 55-like isoform X1 [Manis javanica]|uniref:ankyrin repeat domain-containing protein 55-like isoform X1 n=1 Tax=Manis javanica TaxID=9974 RepID=UPI003C6D6A74
MPRVGFGGSGAAHGGAGANKLFPRIRWFWQGGNAFVPERRASSPSVDHSLLTQNQSLPLSQAVSVPGTPLLPHLVDAASGRKTVLRLACANGHVEAVTLLVKRKCELNLCDNEERTLLIKAIQCQQEDCTLILLEYGANPYVGDISGNSALHCAVCSSRITIAAQLLLYNVDIEARNKHDLTPLLLAISKNNNQMVEFLVSKGANIYISDKNKRDQRTQDNIQTTSTPARTQRLARAKEDSSLTEQTFHLLKTSHRMTLMYAVINGSTNIVKLLLQRDINVSSQDTCGYTAEEYAAIHGFDIILQLICKYSEENEAKNSSQNYQTSSPDLSYGRRK